MIISPGLNIANASPVKKFYKSREGVMAIAFLSIAFILFIVHFVFFRFSFPLNNLDEATFLSPAYNLAVHGTFSTDIHASFLPGADRYTYWVPPLYMFLLGSILKIFGVTIFNAKLFSLLLILLSAVLISLLSKDRYIRIVLVSLLLICPFIIISSARIRMEALGIFLVCLSILAVKKQWPAYITGVIAALAFLTHPLVYGCCAGLAVFNMRRGFKPFLFFALAGVIVMIPDLYYIFQDLAVFKEQMSFQLTRKAAAKLNNLKLEYILQFVPISLAALLFLFLCKKERELRVFLAVSLILTMIVILRSNEFNYQIYTIPYILAAIGLFLEEKRESLYRLAVPALFFTFFLATLLLKGNKNNNFQQDSTYYELTEFLSKDKSWAGKNIYVTGPYDVSTFLILNHQNVERINAANFATSGWYNKFDYVITVVENGKEQKQRKEIHFWKDWDQQNSFTTSDGRYTLYTATTDRSNKASGIAIE